MISCCSLTRTSQNAVSVQTAGREHYSEQERIRSLAEGRLWEPWQSSAVAAHDEDRARALRALALDATKAELRAIDEADLVSAVSAEERAFVRGLDPEKPTLLLPSYVDTQENPTGFESRRDVIFFGGFLAGVGSPNEDALLYLVREIMPSSGMRSQT
jgi:hypothetical protein